MEQVLKSLQSRYSDFTYTKGKVFCWSPATREIFYAAKSDEPQPIWSLLHETSHALLGHTVYASDFELLRFEVAAWERAKTLACEFDLAIDEERVQDCLDTYRDWLYARSICPRCDNKSLQLSDLQLYRCFNCHMTWRVTSSRLCRAYRVINRADEGSAALNLTVLDKL